MSSYRGANPSLRKGNSWGDGRKKGMASSTKTTQNMYNHEVPEALREPEKAHTRIHGQGSKSWVPPKERKEPDFEVELHTHRPNGL
jgi:hypothetical protein